MMKNEFEERIGAEVSTEEYRIVERVYMWHPAIPNVGGKDVIAQLYKLGGMALIEDMDIRATALEEESKSLRMFLQQNAARRGEILKELSDLENRRAVLNAEFDELSQQTEYMRSRLEEVERIG